jgi:H+-transporting ATPase
LGQSKKPGAIKGIFTLAPDIDDHAMPENIMDLSNKRTDDYLGQAARDTAGQLQVDPAVGLTGNEVQARLQRFGYNEITSREEPLWHRVFRRFWGPIPWMIEVAAILSAVVGKWDDFVIITIMLLVNAGLDFFQEHRALNSLKALKQRLKAEIIVLRDGAFKTIPARELVPGDIIRLRIGNIVPADVQLLDGDYLSLDQSALTGESLPVNKKVDEIAYASTIVKQGEMLAVVVNTAARTNFHSVVALVAKASLEERSHFQKMVIRIGDFLILITIVLVMLIVMVSLFRHENYLEIARFALVLAVAAIPVALPAVLSVTMAVGALNLARRQAIVSRLTAIEELAGVDVFCSDKTGTLTQNQMQVAEPVVFAGHDLADLFRLAALASMPENQDPIELPIFEYIKQKQPDADWQSYQQLSFTPFDPIRKRTEAEVQKGEDRFVAMKGAAQVMLDMAQLDDQQMHDINQTVEELASKGYRTLVVGRQRGDAPLELLGLLPLYDPPREDSRQVIADMNADGVEVKMVTGDNLAIARQIGGLLGLEQHSLRARQLAGSASNELLTLASVLSGAIYQKLKPEVSSKDAQRFAAEVIETLKANYDTSLLDQEFIHTHESAIVEMIESVNVFAEVVPEDKYRIVDTLQKAGHIVAMTGDGVNDAPALKKADCGIAVANATDAARAAADIILTAPGLGVINEAMKQARITFERMKSYSIFRITETIRIILFMALSIVVFNFYPITALMIILLALLNDLPILAIAYDNTKVSPRPVRWNMQEILTVASVLGIAGVIASFLLFFLLQEAGFAEPVIQTMLFLKLIVAGHSTLYVTRSQGWFWKRPYPAPLLLAATFGTEIVGTLIAVYGVFVTAIGWEYALWMWGYALAWFVVNDVIKMVAYRMLRAREVI